MTTETTTEEKSGSGYSYSDAMRRNRSEWSDMGIVQLACRWPDIYKGYFTAASMIVSAERLLDLLDSNDESTLTILSNRRNRYVLSYTDLMSYKQNVEIRQAENPVLVEEVNKIARQYQLVRDCERSAAISVKNNDVDATIYFYAKRYALSMLLSGRMKLVDTYSDGGMCPPGFPPFPSANGQLK